MSIDRQAKEQIGRIICHHPTWPSHRFPERGIGVYKPCWPLDRLSGCPIKHARRIIGEHNSYREFLEFGDAEAYREWIKTFAEKKGMGPTKGV